MIEYEVLLLHAMPPPPTTMSDQLEDPEFHARLAALVGETPPFTWAARVGISKGAFSRIWHRGTIPGPRLLRRISAATGVSLDWLVTGEGRPSAGHAGVEGFGGSAYILCAPGACATGHHRRRNDGFVSVPLAHDHASAGGRPALGHEEASDIIAFRHDWLASEFRASPDDLYLVMVEGESMEPTLRPRDVVLVDRHDADTVPRDGIYVVRIDGTLLVKRLQRLPGNRLRLASENQAYREIVVDQGGEGIELIGRVVWVGRKL